MWSGCQTSLYSRQFVEILYSLESSPFIWHVQIFNKHLKFKPHLRVREGYQCVLSLVLVGLYTSILAGAHLM